VKRFESGRDATWREIWRGRIWGAWPARIISDTDELIVNFFDPRATIVVSGDLETRNERKCDMAWTLVERGRLPHFCRTVSLYRPGSAFSVRLAFSPEPGSREGWFGPNWKPSFGAFRGWYVNLEEPWRRTSIGFDTMDHILDLEVAPDLSVCRRKDQGELETAVEMGVVNRTEADRLLHSLDEVIALVEQQAFPFSEDPVGWSPNPDWPVPKLVPGWDAVPIAR